MKNRDSGIILSIEKPRQTQLGEVFRGCSWMLSEAHVELANDRDSQSRCYVKNQRFFFIGSSGCASLNILEQPDIRNEMKTELSTHTSLPKDDLRVPVKPVCNWNSLRPQLFIVTR